jgi:translation initiation factor 2 subunit 1
MSEPNYSHFRYYENKYPEIDEFVMYVFSPARRVAANNMVLTYRR